MRQIFCGIYCIENTVNNKKYIGKAVDIQKRWWGHLHHLRHNNDCAYLQNAWNKHGEESFKFYIIEECPIELLDEKEKFYIAKYKTFGMVENLDII